MIQDREVTLAEAARLFPVSRRELYRWAETGKLMPVSVTRSSGRHRTVRNFRLSEIAALVAETHDTPTIAFPTDETGGR